MKVAGETITGRMFLLGAGSSTTIPEVDGLEGAGYLTSDTVLRLTELPESIAIIGGGYIAAEYGHFFASMGSRVTVDRPEPAVPPGRGARGLGAREARVGEEDDDLDKLRGHGGQEGRRFGEGRHLEGPRERPDNPGRGVRGDGRGGEGADVMAPMHPERAGIKTDERGWLAVERLPADLSAQRMGPGRRHGQVPVQAQGELRLADCLL